MTFCEFIILENRKRNYGGQCPPFMLAASRP